MTTYTPEIGARRIAKLQAMLAERDLDLAVLQFSTDLYYYTGSVQPLYLLVPREGGPLILARKSLNRLQNEVLGIKICAFCGSKEIIAALELAGGLHAKRIGFTLDTASYSTVARFQKMLPGAEFVDISWDLRLLRMVKSAEEIAIFERMGEIMRDIPELAQKYFTPGITELELSAGLEYEMRKRGHDMLIRLRREGVEMSACGVCVSGESTLSGSKFEGVCGGTGLSPAVPYGATHRPIEKGAPIVIDFAFVLEGYHLDQTRMACWGEPAPEVTRAYNAMLDVQQVVFDNLRPGSLWQDAYEKALARAVELGYADTFMGVGTEQVSFVGHGVGLELDEPPVLAPRMPYPLAADMVIAVEPKVALPGIAVVGIEDTVLVREGEPLRLTVCEQGMIIVE